MGNVFLLIYVNVATISMISQTHFKNVSCMMLPLEPKRSSVVQKQL